MLGCATAGLDVDSTVEGVTYLYHFCSDPLLAAGDISCSVRLAERIYCAEGCKERERERLAGAGAGNREQHRRSSKSFVWFGGHALRNRIPHHTPALKPQPRRPATPAAGAEAGSPQPPSGSHFSEPSEGFF